MRSCKRFVSVWERGIPFRDSIAIASIVISIPPSLHPPAPPGHAPEALWALMRSPDKGLERRLPGAV